MPKTEYRKAAPPPEEKKAVSVRSSKPSSIAASKADKAPAEEVKASAHDKEYSDYAKNERRFFGLPSSCSSKGSVPPSHQSQKSAKEERLASHKSQYLDI